MNKLLSFVLPDDQMFMKRISISFAIMLFGIVLSGQINEYGLPLIRNYGIQVTQGSEQNWCITKDYFGHIYFGTQDKGVMRYDGTRWTHINVGKNPRIYSLAADSTGIVYVGAAFEFGYIQPDERGVQVYVSLSERVDSMPVIKNIYTIAIHKGKVYYLGPKFVYIYDVGTDSLSEVDLSVQNIGVAFRLVVINGLMILTDNLNGIFEFDGKSVSELPGGDFFRGKFCTVLLPFDDDQILIGTYREGIFLYNYKTGAINSNFIDSQLNEKLMTVNVYSGTWLNRDVFAIGTTNTEGLLVFKRTGQLIQQINAGNSDLADNQMMAVYCDDVKGSELWLSTFGVISKLYFNIPVTQFSEKQGILSGINEISRFRNNFYLSSDEGIFKSSVNDSNNISFNKIKGVNAQVFPLEVIKSEQEDFILAGSLDGLLQISGNDIVTRIESVCRNLPAEEKRGMNVREILQSALNPGTIYLGLFERLIILNYDGARWTFKGRIRIVPGSISGIVEEKSGELWVLTDDPSVLYNIVFSANDTSLVKYGSDKGLPDIDLNSIGLIGDDLFVCTGNGIFKYDKDNDIFLNDKTVLGLYSNGKNSRSLYRDDEGDLWYSGDDKKTFESLIRIEDGDTTIFEGILRLLPEAPLVDMSYYNERVYILKSKSIYVIEKSKLVTDSALVNTLFTSITIGQDSAVMTGSFFRKVNQNRREPVLAVISSFIPQFRYDFNNIAFEWTTTDYIEELSTEYSHKLEGFDEEWSPWEGTSSGRYFKQTYTNLPHGRYVFRVRTRTLSGLGGNILNYEFIIKKAWYATAAAIMMFILIAFMIIYLVIKEYTRRLRNENIRLEGIVRERTAVVVKQKEELESSIHYASRIQLALLPSEAILSEMINNYFLLFKPRDIVSGDFYWLTRRADRLYIVVADCTGHGVPGAFMSLLGMSFLDEIIDKDQSPRADDVLKQLRLHVIESLKQVGNEGEAQDGMDIALLVLDFGRRKVEFSGAYNPCFRVRKMTSDEIALYDGSMNEDTNGTMSNGKHLLETINADKMPIGISPKMNQEFACNEHNLENGISYYLFSDGYVDQFGGPNGKKFMKKNFKKLLLEIQDHPMEEQKRLLEKSLADWMGETDQIDDILVMGIKTG